MRIPRLFLTVFLFPAIPPGAPTRSVSPAIELFKHVLGVVAKDRMGTHGAHCDLIVANSETEENDHASKIISHVEESMALVSVSIAPATGKSRMQ